MLKMKKIAGIALATTIALGGLGSFTTSNASAASSSCTKPVDTIRVSVGETSDYIYGDHFVPVYGWPEIYDITDYGDGSATVEGIKSGTGCIEVIESDGSKSYYKVRVR